MFNTPDLCDAHTDIQVAEPLFTNYGRRKRFSGPISTVKVFEDNVLVVEALEQAEPGSVLVVDGGGSLKCALMGDRLARIGVTSRIAGIIINGAVRDSVELGKFDIAVLALATCPKRSNKEGKGERDVGLEFAGIRWTPGHTVYGDADGVVLSSAQLT